MQVMGEKQSGQVFILGTLDNGDCNPEDAVWQNALISLLHNLASSKVKTAVQNTPARNQAQSICVDYLLALAGKVMMPSESLLPP
jgi:hypothetical protein